MAKLYFEVQADYQKVIKLREEIDKLEKQLKSFSRNTPIGEIKDVEMRLSSAKAEFTAVATEAAKAGAKIEIGFKNQIYQASQNVNILTERIIAQKSVIKDVEHDVKRLGDAYKSSLKANSSKSSSLKSEWESAKKALDEEKASLFQLTQEKATNQLAVKKLKDEYTAFKDEAEDTNDTVAKLSGSFGKALAAIGGISALKSLGSEIIRVRGEFQEMETAIETLVGKGMANKLLPQIKELAKVSHLTMTDIVGAEKMMLGFNIEADKTIGFLKALSDVSMGSSQKFNSLTLAFSQMSAAGKLMGQDLNQMINAGFNPLQQISQTTGKSIAVLKEEMSKGAVSAEMVQQAFIDATSAGGKFYKMSENASQTINGQMSMMEDAWDSALNEMGENSEEFIMSGIQATTSLIQNYQTVGEVLAFLIANYGIYKAALLANIALEKTQAVVRLANIKHTSALSIATGILTGKVKALSAAMLKNPYVLLATAITTALAATYKVATSTSIAEEAQNRLNKSVSDVEKSLISEISKLNSLQRQLKETENGTEEYSKIKNTIVDNYGQYFNGLDKEIERVGDLSDAYVTLVDNMRKSIGQRQFESFFNAELSNMDKVVGEKIDKAYETLIDKYGDTEGLNLYQRFYDSVMNGATLTSNEIKKLKDATFFETTWGDDAQDGLVDFTNDVYNLRSEINKTKTATDNAIKAYQKKYNISDDSAVSLLGGGEVEDTSTDESYQKAYKAAEKRWQAAKKALNDAKNKNKSDYDNAKKELEVAETEFKKLGGDTSGKTQKQEDKAAEEAQRRAEELLSIRRQNQQEEINLMKEGSAKKIAQINLDYQQEIDAIKKQEAEWKKAHDGKLTSEQEETLSKQGSIAVQTREKELADLKKANLKDELQAMYDYLQEYGTIQQQKYAIAKAYDMKIAEESNATRKMMLEKEKETRIASLDAENIAMQIDWSTAFEGVGTVLGDIATETLQKVEEYMKTAEFKNLSAENKKAYSDFRGKLKNEVGGSTSPFDFKQWDVIAEQVKQYQDSVKNLLNAESQHEIAVNNLKKAQENLANATDETAKEVAQAAVDVAQGVADAAGKNLKNAENKKNETQGNLQDSTDKAVKGLQNFSTALNTMASGSLYGFANGVTQLIQTISGSATEGLRGLGKVGGIVGAILQIIEALGDNPKQFIEDLLKNVADTVSQVIADLPEIVVSVLEGVVDIVGGVLGGIGSWFGIDNVGESDKTLQEDTERLIAVNEELIRAIENLSEEMKEATMVESKEMYERQKDYLNTSMKNTQELMERSAEAYSNGFLGFGGTHSSGYYIDKAMKPSELVDTPFGSYYKVTDLWKELSDIVGFSITSAEDFFNLTAEQMYQVATKAPEYYAIIKEAADDGHKDAAQYMDEYLEYYEQLQELENQYREKLTHTSFDSIKDDFKSLLMDMESDAEDFAELFEKMMKEAIVESFILQNYKAKLQQFYTNFANAMESDGNIDKDEQNALRTEWEGYVNDATAERDALFKTMGWDSSSYSQEASSKGFQAMSQDTGDELNGRFTALQIAGEETKTQVTLLNITANEIKAIQNGVKDIATGIQDQLASSYLELVAINENTGMSAKYLKDIKNDITEVKDKIKNL